MPVFLAHGEQAALMPVDQARQLAGIMAECPSFAYRGVPGGDHDAPLWLSDALAWMVARI